LQHDSITLDGKQLLRGKLPGFHKMWYNACHAAKNVGGSFKGMDMSCQVGEACCCATSLACSGEWSRKLSLFCDPAYCANLAVMSLTQQQLPLSTPAPLSM